MTCACRRPCIFQRRWRPISPLSPFRTPASQPCKAADWDTITGLNGPVRSMAGWWKNSQRKAPKPSPSTCSSANCNRTIPPCKWPTQYIDSDDFFALQCRLAGNVILAATPDLMPPGLFATNALALGDITTEKDSDGAPAGESLPFGPPLASAQRPRGTEVWCQFE